MLFICSDGDFVPASQPVLTADNRGYRYGDGLFETMKLAKGKLPLAAWHFDRLFKGLQLLKYNVPPHINPDKLTHDILQLHEMNGQHDTARIRLSVSRNNTDDHGWKNPAHYIIEYFPRDNAANELNERGFSVDIFLSVRKTCDAFSNLKSANYLQYAMASIHARENELDDCLVLNQHDRIAESSIANVFIIKDNQIITPPLTEGCVAGVMRKWLLEKLQSSGDYKIREDNITTDLLSTADELFLTNAMYGIRWVQQFRNTIYTNKQTVEIYKRYIQTIWQ